MIVEAPWPTAKGLAEQMPMSIDLPGIFFVEARAMVAKANSELSQLQEYIGQHESRVEAARAGDDDEDAWVAVLQQVGALETTFARVIRHYVTADVLLVVASEAYINIVAQHVLGAAEAEHFDKLSPTGKWLLLPRIMKLKWKPSAGAAPLQQYAALVQRRNRAIHSKLVAIRGVTDLRAFLGKLSLNARAAEQGVESVKRLVREFSLSWRGSNGPDWLELAGARARPPCFLLGTPEAPGRLGRARRGR